MQLSDILSATSVLLVFVILTFEKLNTSINTVLQTKAPDEIKKTEFNHYRSLLRITLVKAIIFSILLGAIFYIFLPLTLTIIGNSTFSLWNFDLLETLFVGIESCILSIVIYVGWLAIKVYRKQ